ncbi:PREDICTED: uncharacterized protein LOC109181237 [Ipomoea nil]|uniref:uncharacterized protein LOC109152701 n=1 Tax=Ipomoea nil TaxID=35883 RepID=UPI000900D093|nr:PREDICTED: uncharacterized protein LOC109152701 [Ipomoea nil]XP_019186534.1 PREDICTED: uncharacterized protein LOC109181237 [Ipomoea nil]
MANSYSSSSSSNHGNEFYEFGERFPIVHCRCGEQLKIRTSWTAENPGRRFWQCVGGNRKVGCGFIDWYDTPMCYRSKRIIPGLLKRINRQDEEIRKLNSKLRSEQGLKSMNKAFGPALPFMYELWLDMYVGQTYGNHMLHYHSQKSSVH